MTHPETAEPSRAGLANGFGIAGFVIALLGIAIFFVPFLNLLCALVGLAFSARATFLARESTEPGATGALLAVAGLILGVIGLIPGALITGFVMFVRH